MVFCREDQAATTVFGRIGKSENTFVIIPNVYALEKGAGVTSIYTDACLCWQPSVSRFQEFQRQASISGCIHDEICFKGFAVAARRFITNSRGGEDMRFAHDTEGSASTSYCYIPYALDLPSQGALNQGPGHGVRLPAEFNSRPNILTRDLIEDIVPRFHRFRSGSHKLIAETRKQIL